MSEFDPVTAEFPVEYRPPNDIPGECEYRAPEPPEKYVHVVLACQKVKLGSDGIEWLQARKKP